MSKKRETLGAIGVFAATLAPEVPNTIQGKSEPRPDRADRAPLPFWATSAAKKQLRFFVAEHDSNQQAPMTEALNLLFKKYGKPPMLDHRVTGSYG